MQKIDLKALLVLFLINLNQIIWAYNPPSFPPYSPPGMPGMPGMPGAANAAPNANNKTGGNTPPAYLKTSAFTDIGKAPANTSSDQFNQNFFEDDDWSSAQLFVASAPSSTPPDSTPDAFGFANSDIAAGQ